MENQCRKQGHKRDFQQIIQNLLENAAKYSPADQPIHVRLTQDQTHLSLTVADFGIGIPNDKKALILSVSIEWKILVPVKFPVQESDYHW